jgi:hypothetical protein
MGPNGISMVNQSLNNVSPLNIGGMVGNQNSLTKVSSSRKLEGTGPQHSLSGGNNDIGSGNGHHN